MTKSPAAFRQRVVVVHPAVIGLVSGLVILLRQPWQLAGGAFPEEVAMAAVPVPVWHGFVHVLPWLAVRAGIGFLAFAVVVALVSAFIASTELGVGPALLLPLIPFSGSAMATVLDAHFVLGLYLALLLVAKSSRWDVPAAAFAALNGPSSIILAPLYLWRARHRPMLVAAVLLPAALQVAVFLGSGRRIVQ